MRADNCTDSFVRFVDLTARSAGQIRPSPVTSLDDCRTLCLSRDNCAGFNWVRDGRVVSDKCLLYTLDVGDTVTMTNSDLYVRERCQPNMLITFAPGMMPRTVYLEAGASRGQLLSTNFSMPEKCPPKYNIYSWQSKFCGSLRV